MFLLAVNNGSRLYVNIQPKKYSMNVKLYKDPQFATVYNDAVEAAKAYSNNIEYIMSAVEEEYTYLADRTFEEEKESITIDIVEAQPTLTGKSMSISSMFNLLNE